MRISISLFGKIFATMIIVNIVDCVPQGEGLHHLNGESDNTIHKNKQNFMMTDDLHVP